MHLPTHLPLHSSSTLDTALQLRRSRIDILPRPFSNCAAVVSSDMRACQRILKTQHMYCFSRIQCLLYSWGATITPRNFD
ncbi:hypothetical protein QC762_305424 [Podospora pseudocomata]|uniref:Uncharacterized protein n=1 Tax=Podospora pseudocomata TaxID=2093779 RepID=A0ABR0GJL4_9PEZI|nr:hypothetical protein QC762_305424 [Podospora pseudocomata]